MGSDGYCFRSRGGAVVDFNQDPRYPQAAADLLKIDRNYFGTCSTIAVWNSGQLGCIAVYSAFNGINCECTIAAVNKWWTRKEILKVLMDYPFTQLGCERVTLLVRDDNKRTCNLVEKIGFVREGTLRRMHPDGMNTAIYGLLKAERIY